jgi:hypothetical protein
MEKRYPSDYTDEELREQARELECAVTISVDLEIKVDHRVLDLGEVEKILGKGKNIVLQDCGCRIDKGNCYAPRDVCISIEPEHRTCKGLRDQVRKIPPSQVHTGGGTQRSEKEPRGRPSPQGLPPDGQRPPPR